MTDQEMLKIVLEKITNMESAMATKSEIIKIKNDLIEIKSDLTDLKATTANKEELQEVKNIVVKIENDHSQRLGALFDGFTLISEKLEGIEEVLKRKEII